MRLPFLLAAAGLPLSALAQIVCNQSVGPDLVIGDMVGYVNYPAAGGLDAFSVGTMQTNIGTVWTSYSATTPAHPIIAQNLYRLSTASGAGRFEQIGQSWLFHGFCALSSNIPCGFCSPPPDCSHLGPNCSTSDTPSITGSQQALSPRWQVNPTTGTFAYPPANPPYSGTVARRLQAHIADLNGTDSFYVEAMVIAADDALLAANTANNCTYHRVIFSGGPTDYTLGFSGTTVPLRPAIAAWKAADPGVTESHVQAPGGGTVILSSRATPIPGGGWHYEYALFNQNADAGIGSITVIAGYPEPTNVGFHDVDYTDGDGEGGITRDGTDWAYSFGAGASYANWQTTPYASDHNANALLWGTLYNFWGTLYNFRFDSTRPPMQGEVLASTWKANGLLRFVAQTPLPDCYANCDGSTIAPVLNVNDFSCFLNRYAAGDTRANCDQSTGDPLLTVLDFACFINAFAAGCF